MNPKKILLAVLPFRDPLIPPMGISCLESFLEGHGFSVRKVDANVEGDFKEIYDGYFEKLKAFVPPDKRSNFYNIGKDVLINHMMAHIHHQNEEEYIELVKILISRTFFFEVDGRQVDELNRVLSEFYARLERFLLSLLDREGPDVLGISVFKGTVPASLFAFKLAKKNYPHIKTVMGGGVFADQLALDSPDLAFFLEKTPYIDKIIVGEGELLLLKYLENELPESKKVVTLNDINGETLDLSTADIPDFSDLDLRFYPFLGAYTSRSCPFQCKFCSETVRWGNYRKKSARQVAEELQRLYGKYGVQLYMMSDSLLNPIVTDLADELLKSDVPLYWDGYLRVEPAVCRTENTLLWRRGGFYRARLGVESGSRRILEAMDKKITPGQIKEAVRALADVGIKTTTYWIVGYPQETEDDFRQTLELVEELKNDIYEAEFNAFWYYPKGQVDSDKWSRKSKLLYPENARDMLILQTRILDYEPSREETYRRLARLVECCNRLKIPNPYSLYDISKADERWEALHKNAVPSLLRFKNRNEYIDECRGVENIFSARDTQPMDGEWGF